MIQCGTRMIIHTGNGICLSFTHLYRQACFHFSLSKLCRIPSNRTKCDTDSCHKTSKADWHTSLKEGYLTIIITKECYLSITIIKEGCLTIIITKCESTTVQSKNAAIWLAKPLTLQSMVDSEYCQTVCGSKQKWNTKIWAW